VPEAYTFLEEGRVVDYNTTRETAPLLAEWYAKQGRTVRSHGTTIASMPTSVPVGASGHVHIASAVGRATLQELTKEITHGFVLHRGDANVDLGLTSGSFNAGFGLEIKNGVPVARTWILLQFATKRMLQKQLTAIGDASTARTARVGTAKGIPWQRIVQPITAPAALIKDLDIIMWDRMP
jgi:TldD protein